MGAKRVPAPPAFSAPCHTPLLLWVFGIVTLGMLAHEKINGHRELTESSPWAHGDHGGHGSGGPMITAQSWLGEVPAQSRQGHSSVTARSQLSHGEVTAQSWHLQYDHGSFTARSQLNHGPDHGSVTTGCDHFGHRELTVSSHGGQYFFHVWYMPISMHLTLATLKVCQLEQETVSKIINKISSKHSCGHDDISTILIKNLPPHIITNHFSLKSNAFYRNFSRQVKNCKNNSIIKKENPHKLDNYRPISLLPAFSKIFEKAVFIQLNCMINNLLYKSQYGFALCIQQN